MGLIPQLWHRIVKDDVVSLHYRTIMKCSDGSYITWGKNELLYPALQQGLFDLHTTKQREPWWSPDLRPHYDWNFDCWMPVLSVGNKVRYDLDHNGWPRWNYNEDRGSGNCTQTLPITDVDTTRFKVETKRYNLLPWIFPLPNHSQFPGYGKPGWPIRIDVWEDFVEQEQVSQSSYIEPNRFVSIIKET